MAIANVGTRGTQISSTSGTTIARAPSATVAVDRILVCQIAQNGNQSTTVSDAQGNTWEFLGSGSGTNARSDIWIARITTALTTANNVTVTFGGAVTHKSMLLWEFSVAAGAKLILSTSAVPNSTSAVNGFGSVNFAGLPSLQRLYLRALAKQANITTTITSANSFTSQGLAIRSQNNASAIAQRGEYRINTSTGETSNPTLANTGNTGNVFVALEEFTPPAAQSLTPGLYTNANTVYAATVAAGPVTLTAARYDNGQAFYAATITQGGGGQTLLPGLYTNAPAFYGPTITATRALTPARFDNTPTFYAATVTSVRVLTPARYDNAATFFGPTVAVGAVTLAPARYDNAASFYSPLVTQGAGALVLGPDLFVNTNTFYGGLFTQFITFPDFVEPGHVEPGWVGWPYFNAPQFFAATVQPGPVGLFPTRYDDPDAFFGATVGEALLSGNRFQFIRRRRRC
jgi:hypothetical protein